MTINAFLQADEDDAGHKGLQNFEETWDCGQKSTYLTRFGTGQPNLNGVQDEGQNGGNSGTNLYATVGASVKDRIDDGCCQHLYKEKQQRWYTLFIYLSNILLLNIPHLSLVPANCKHAYLQLLKSDM